MNTLFWIIIFSLIGSVGAMIGGLLLLWRDKWVNRISPFLISFAGGVLLAVGLLDLLPEALELTENTETIFFIAAFAILALFALERMLWWYHHHKMDSGHHSKTIEDRLTKSKAYSVLIGDGIHNFVDGILIAVAFLTSFPLGVAVSIGVIFHEIPQEIADFSIMLRVGIKKKKVLFYNILASLATVLGAILTYNFASFLQGSMQYALAFAAGVFLHISLSSLMPEIQHQSEHNKNFIIHFAIFILGMAFIVLT